MKFTDKDLKRTKKEIPEGQAGYGFDSMHSFSVDDLEALLHRLECAEAVFETDPEDAEAQRKAYEAWLQSKGEAGEK